MKARHASRIIAAQVRTLAELLSPIEYDRFVEQLYADAWALHEDLSDRRSQARAMLADKKRKPAPKPQRRSLS